MTWVPDRPLLGTLVLRALADIDAALGAEAALDPDAPEYVLAANAAAQADGVYGSAEQIARNIVPGRDNDPEALRRHSRNWLGDDDGPRTASPARLPIVDSGNSVDGTPIPTGTRFRTGDGALYETTEDLVVGTDDITVLSIAAEGETGYGASGNKVPGLTLTRVTEVDDLDTLWIVDGDPADGAIGGGADEETHDELADRTEFSAQNPPQAGTRANIEAWAREVPGVGKAWAYSWVRGPGTTTVFFTRSDPDNPLPDATLRNTVQAHLDEKIALHSDGIILVGEMVAHTVTPTIALKPNNSTTRSAAYAALREAIILRRKAGDGTWYLDRSWLTEALSAAVGEEGHTLTVPAADITPALGHLVVLAAFNAVTFTTKT
jgi:uncharacterized phage protein gp47/JayE